MWLIPIKMHQTIHSVKLKSAKNVHKGALRKLRDIFHRCKFLHIRYSPFIKKIIANRWVILKVKKRLVTHCLELINDLKGITSQNFSWECIDVLWCINNVQKAAIPDSQSLLNIWNTVYKK
jgi:hypothetical protein